MTRELTRWQARLGLICLAAFTSTNFIAMKIAVEETSAFSVVLWRFFFAVVFFLCLKKKIGFKINTQAWRDGVGVGSILAVSMIMLAATMQVAKTGEAAFFVNTDALFVPLLLFIFFRQLPPWNALCGLAMAIPGLALLSIKEEFQLREGSLVGMLAAVGFAAWLIGATKVTKRNHPFALSFTQMVTVFVMALSGALVFGQFRCPQTLTGWLVCFYLGAIGTGLRFAVQGYLQRFIVPTETALIYLIEPVCAAVCGMVVLHEHLTGKQLWGCALILSGVAFSGIRISRAQAIAVANQS